MALLIQVSNRNADLCRPVSRIRISLMRIRILLATLIADPDQLPSEGSKPWKKCSNRLIIHTFSLVICKLTRIQIQLITLMRCGSGSSISLWCGSGSFRILPFNMVWIRIPNIGAGRQSSVISVIFCIGPTEFSVKIFQQLLAINWSQDFCQLKWHNISRP